MRLYDVVSEETATRLLRLTAFLWGFGAPHIPSQTDTVVRFVQEHVVLFLRLYDLGSKVAPQGYYV